MRQFVLWILFTAVTLTGGTGPLANYIQTHTNYSEVCVDYEMHTFDEAIQLSNCVVVGQYLGHQSVDSMYGIEMLFRVREVLRGEITEKIIRVSESESYTYVDFGRLGELRIHQVSIERGQEFILVLGRNDSICHAYPRYYRISGIRIPVDSPESIDEIKALIREV